ncbi:uncharacterized protein LOC134752600 [Cydia strobilella]|uniref:uncharacterized protein LOC134752600 n=1 Tax=Cydia strobilella TaxID=1100964 RepID=UPI0030065A9E
MRPITATFTTLGIKIDIFKQRSALKDTAYYIKEDYPLYVLEKRRQLQEQVRAEREKGNYATIKYDKLVIHSNTNATSKNKRMLSLSPESNNSTQDENKRSQASKKNKTQAPIKRTSSLSEGVLKPGILNYLTSSKNSSKTPKQQHDDENTII